MKALLLSAVFAIVLQLVFAGVAKAEPEDLDRYNRAAIDYNGIDIYGY